MEGPGVSIPKHKDIDKLADQFVEKRDTKATLASQMGDIERKIIEKMIEHGLTRYRFSDQEIIIKPGKNHVKVKTVKVDPADAEEPPTED